MKRIVIALVIISIGVLATACSNCLTPSNEAGFEVFDGATINPEIFTTGATRAVILNEIRTRHNEPTYYYEVLALLDEGKYDEANALSTDYFTMAWFDDNGILELAAEAASWGQTEWTIIYQSENKAFITEWQDDIEFRISTQPLDIIGMFGFDFVMVWDREHPLLIDDAWGRKFVYRYTLNDDSRLYFRFWRGNVGPTELDAVYRYIDGEFIEIFTGR